MNYDPDNPKRIFAPNDDKIVNLGEKVCVMPGGEICVLIPLFTRVQASLDKMAGYRISLEHDEPVFWCLEWGEGPRDRQIFNPMILENVEVLGDL